MERRKEAALMARLDRVATHGVAEITLGELRHWFDVQRMGKSSWRELIERWDEISPVPLLVARVNDNFIFTLANCEFSPIATRTGESE